MKLEIFKSALMKPSINSWVDVTSLFKHDKDTSIEGVLGIFSNDFSSDPSINHFGPLFIYRLARPKTTQHFFDLSGEIIGSNQKNNSVSLDAESIFFIYKFTSNSFDCLKIPNGIIIPQITTLPQGMAFRGELNSKGAQNFKLNLSEFIKSSYYEFFNGPLSIDDGPINRY